MQTDFVRARDPFFCVIFVFYVFLCSFANFRIRTEMHVSRFSFWKRVGGRTGDRMCARVGVCGPLSRAHTETVFMVFFSSFFICKRMRAKKKKKCEFTKEDGVLVRFVLSLHVCCAVLAEKKVVYDKAIATLLLSSFFCFRYLSSSLHRSVFNFDRHRCHDDDNVGIPGTRIQHIPHNPITLRDYYRLHEHTPFTVRPHPFHIHIHIHMVQCETYDSRQYKICNRSQIKSNSSGHTRA